MIKVHLFCIVLYLNLSLCSHSCLWRREGLLLNLVMQHGLLGGMEADCDCRTNSQGSFILHCVDS